jgi:predicted nucleotidyltransferase
MFKKMNILELFLKEPNKEFNVREVAKILKKAPATASKKLKELEKEGLLKQRDFRMLKLFQANLDSEKLRDYKIFYNIRKIKESILIDELNKFYLKPTIVLFGSLSKGYDVKESDIDLLIISENKKEFPNLKKIQKELGKEIQLFVVKSVKNLKNEHLINNVLNGITLQGSVKWI